MPGSAFLSKVNQIVLRKVLLVTETNLYFVINIVLRKLKCFLFLQFVLPSGSQASSKISSQIFPHVRSLSGDAGRSTTVQLGENGTRGFTRGSFIFWIQSSDPILLYNRCHVCFSFVGLACLP